MVVGSVLALLLLLASWSLPEPPESFADRPEVIGRATIRIRSARTWPEKVVLDTSQPTIPPPSIEVVSAQQLVERLPDGMTIKRMLSPWLSQNLIHGGSMLITRPREPSVRRSGGSIDSRGEIS